MQAYRVEKQLTEDGKLLLDKLPFHAGESVEVIVLAHPQPTKTNAYPLRGKVIRYDYPTDPVSGDAWEALK